MMIQSQYMSGRRRMKWTIASPCKIRPHGVNRNLISGSSGLYHAQRIANDSCLDQLGTTFQKAIAPDAVWLDEDGHHLQATVWINRPLWANPPRKLSITNLRTSNWDSAGWAGFNYLIEGTNQMKGTNSLVFKKNGADWQIALIHGAVDTAIGAH